MLADEIDDQHLASTSKKPASGLKEKRISVYANVAIKSSSTASNTVGAADKADTETGASGVAGSNSISATPVPQSHKKNGVQFVTT